MKNIWVRFILFVLGCLFFLSLAVVECVRGEELGWDGMPASRPKKEDSRLTKNWHFLFTTATAFAFTIGDIEYSIHNINKHGAREGNHFARSWIEGGRSRAYTYGCGVTGLTMLGSYLLFRSKDPDTQKLWIILPSICIVGHSVGIGLNIAF